MDIARRLGLMSVFAIMVGVKPTVSFAQEKIEGKVLHTNLTGCAPRPSGGGCEGTLTLEPKAGGTAQAMAIKVTADTLIRKGDAFVFLPSTQGNSVVVNYVTHKGEKVAKSIDVLGGGQ